MKRSHRLLWISSVLATVLVRTIAAGEPGTNAPLYLLTYDHGGVILWGADHFAERLRNAVSWLDRYPYFKIGLENEAYLYDYLDEHHPALLGELQGDLKKYSGRFALGTCTYGQPLSTFINEECNIRQVAYAIRTEQKYFGYRPPVYLMSEHAMHSQLPQILDGFGFQAAILRTHFMMYGFNPTFDVPVGWWVGLDGSRIPAVPTYPGEGAAFGRTTSDNWFLTRYPGPEAKQSPEEFRKEFAHITPLVATRADDSGLRKEDLVKLCSDRARYQWVLLDDLSSILPKPELEMRTLPEDFTVRMPWGYCGNEIWNLNRRAEAAVLTAERLAVMEQLLGGSFHEPELEQAWKNLLVGQHHDIQICGLLPEAHRFLSASIRTSESVSDAALRFAASNLKGEGLAQVTAFNPLSWSRHAWIETDVSVTRPGIKSLVARCAGRVAPSTILHADRSSDGSIRAARLAFSAEIPGLAIAAYSIVPGDELARRGGASEIGQPRVEVQKEKLRVYTPDYDAQLDSGGGFASLINRRTGKQLLQQGKRSAFFAGRIDGQDCESHGRWTLHPAGEAEPWVTAREDGFIDQIPYTFEVRFRADTPQLDCRVTFHLDEEKIGLLSNDPRDSHAPFVHENKLRFKLFPTAEAKQVGLRDLPFAIAETTNRYVQGLYWTALKATGGGLAFLNRGTMGAVREADGGFSLPLAYSMYYIWGTRLLKGDFSYEFAVFPFAGDIGPFELHREALEYNFPIVSAAGEPRALGHVGSVFQPLAFRSKKAIVTALFPEQGAIYARVFSCSETPEEVSVAAPGGETRVWTTDLLGSDEQTVANPVSLRPWQFRTLKVQVAN